MLSTDISALSFVLSAATGGQPHVLSADTSGLFGLVLSVDTNRLSVCSVVS